MIVKGALYLPRCIFPSVYNNPFFFVRQNSMIPIFWVLQCGKKSKLNLLLLTTLLNNLGLKQFHKEYNYKCHVFYSRGNVLEQINKCSFMKNTTTVLSCRIVRFSNPVDDNRLSAPTLT